MNDLNNKLDKIGINKNNPFLVPKGYFDEFPSKLQDKILSEHKEYTWILKFFRYVKPQFALAFMIIVFAVTAITTTNLILSSREEAGVSLEYYTRIIEVEPSEYTEQQIIDILLEDEKKVEKEKKKESDNYIHYLVNEDIDYGTLIDEL